MNYKITKRNIPKVILLTFLSAFIIVSGMYLLSDFLLQLPIITNSSLFALPTFFILPLLVIIIGSFITSYVGKLFGFTNKKKIFIICFSIWFLIIELFLVIVEVSYITRPTFDTDFTIPRI